MWQKIHEMPHPGHFLTAGQSGDQEHRWAEGRHLKTQLKASHESGKGHGDSVGMLGTLAHVHSSCGSRLCRTRSWSHEAMLTGTQEPSQST